MVHLKQIGIGAAGLVVAGVMLWLGLWQMSAYRHSGEDAAVARMNQPPVALVEHVTGDGSVGDVYGRRVTASGQYRPDLTLLVGLDYPLRAVSGFELPDGRLVAVVRGTIASGSQVPAAPSGVHEIEGVFLASDPHDPPAQASGLPEGTLPNLRLQRLVQEWPGQLVSGYITLNETLATEQGLTPSVPDLPEADGRAQNSGYALQWWVFAGFALIVTVLAIRKVGRDADASQP